MDRKLQPLGRGVKMVFLLVGVLTLVVGLAMFFFPQPIGLGTGESRGRVTEDQLWPYPLWSNYMTRFLGSLFTGVGVGAFWASRQAVWGDVRGLFLPGMTFTGLATIASFISLDGFNLQRITTWAFFAIYIGVLIAGIITYVRYEYRQA